MTCSMFPQHHPVPLTTELHHVVPVAWQQIPWQPATAPYPGVDQDGRGKLWDARTVALCPTHHRNVHIWIVRLMRALQGEDVATAVTVVLKAAALHRAPMELRVARQGLERFQAAGGKLQDLVALSLWGQA